MTSNTKLSPAERRLLEYLSAPGASIKREQIAQDVGVHNGTLSRIICRLERHGLLEIQRDAVNRRGRHSYSKITVASKAHAA